MSRLFAISAIVGACMLAPSVALATETSDTLSSSSSALVSFLTNKTQSCSISLASGGQPVDPTARPFEVLEGEQALSHLRNLKAKRPQAWARAEQILRERGFKPTGEVIVMRSTTHAKSKGKARKPFAFADSETIYDSSGEVTFWSWDDGVDGTWEGSVYMADYQNGIDGMADAQMFFDTPDFYTMWEYDVYVGGPEGPVYPEQQMASYLGKQPLYQLASVAPMAPGIQRVYCGTRFVQDWGWCLAPACGWSMYDCAKLRFMRGPAFAGCVKIGCGAAAIGCAGPALVNAYYCMR